MKLPIPLRWYGFPLVMASIAWTGIGEWMLLFNPQGGYNFNTYDFLVGRSPEFIHAGHWISVLFAPAYLWGYVLLDKIIFKASRL